MRASSARAGVAEMSAAPTPLQIRGRFLTAVVVPVSGGAGEAFYAGLDALLQQSPQFFADAPLVLDMAGAPGFEDEAAFEDLLSALRDRRLTPIGIQNASGEQEAAAFSAGIASLPAGRDRPVSTPRAVEPAQAETALAETTEPQDDPTSGTLIVTEPVRSGQRIFADRGDLVVVSSVSSGAELVALGNIHVYGRLRGRAIAGVGGDTSARIFCQGLEAELIAIAGYYKTSEGFGAAFAKGRVQAFLKQDTLAIEALK